MRDLSKSGLYLYGFVPIPITGLNPHLVILYNPTKLLANYIRRNCSLRNNALFQN